MNTFGSFYRSTFYLNFSGYSSFIFSACLSFLNVLNLSTAQPRICIRCTSPHFRFS